MMSNKTCPACDSNLLGEESACPNCGVVLSIFVDGESISITEGDIATRVSQIVAIADTADELNIAALVIAIGESTGTQSDTFACPACGEILPISATFCIKCNAQFVEADAEQFQCPICSSMVEASATKCPKCGAAFAEAEPDEETSENPEEKEKSEIEENDEKEDKEQKTKDKKKTEFISDKDKKEKEKKKKGDRGWGNLIKRKK